MGVRLCWQTGSWWSRGQRRSWRGRGRVTSPSLWWGIPSGALGKLVGFYGFYVLLFFPSSATTHTDLLLRALERGIPYQVVHNASILNAIGCCGLQLYHFGETVSIPFWTETWKPDSFVDRVEGNLQRGLHTLCLLGGEVLGPSVALPSVTCCSPSSQTLK